MCGIFGMYLNRPLTDDDLFLGRRCVAALAHRGPDGQGEWFDRGAGVYLGHRRLAIIDLSDSSAQPFVGDGQAFVYNGEIYNFKELRRQLEKAGRTFVSNGDGEVFFQGWQQWGEAVLEKIDGMFAMARWDGRSITLAVDVFGEKPLFVAETYDGVYFSSEIAPLADQLGLMPSISPRLWAAYLSLGFFPQPQTVYPQVTMVEPASIVTIDRGVRSPARIYWMMPPVSARTGRAKPVSDSELDSLAAALTSSLSSRLIADVPLALLLSSGIDSALVASLCRYELNVSLDCFTLSFPHGEVTDESAAARAIAKYMGFNHVVSESNSELSPRRIVDLLGQPSGNVGILSLEQVCSQARGLGYKVAITGMGGDEVTWGYAKHQYYWKLRSWYRLPDGVRRLIGSVVGKLGRRGRRLGLRMRSKRREVYVADKNFPTLDLLRQLPEFAEWIDDEFLMSSGTNKFPLEMAVPAYELCRVMPAVHLLCADHASMRHGLELRTPFLNRDVVNVIASMDPRALLAFGQKSVLRRILTRYLPSGLVDRRKMGFSYPRTALVRGAVPTRLPGLSTAIANELWEHRADGEGWLVNAVRLASADQFFRDKGN